VWIWLAALPNGKSLLIHAGAGSSPIETRIDEIGDRIYRLSTYVPEIVPLAGFTFNQFLILGEEPMLFHAGFRRMFPLVSEAVFRIMPVKDLRWITFGHYEADECGAMNEWLTVAPNAQVAHRMTGCLVSLNAIGRRGCWRTAR
jgi:flavorubredoxin